MRFFVYILRCANGTFYTGHSSDLALQISQHTAGLNPKAYTYRLRPVKLVWSQEVLTRYDALNVEKRIKGWSHAKKEALINDDFQLLHQIVKNERIMREKHKK